MADDDDWLICRFRFPRVVLLDLCAEVFLLLETVTHQNHCIVVHIQALTTFGFPAGMS